MREIDCVQGKRENQLATDTKLDNNGYVAGKFDRTSVGPGHECHNTGRSLLHTPPQQQTPFQLCLWPQQANQHVWEMRARTGDILVCGGLSVWLEEGCIEKWVGGCPKWIPPTACLIMPPAGNPEGVVSACP